MTKSVIYFFQDIQTQSLLPYTINSTKPLTESDILSHLHIQAYGKKTLQFRIGVVNDIPSVQAGKNTTENKLKWLKTVYTIGNAHINDIDLFGFTIYPFILNQSTQETHSLTENDKVFNNEWKQVYPEQKPLTFYKKIINSFTRQEKLH